MSYDLPASLASYPLRTSRRGHFWIPGEIVQTPGGTVMRAPMFVQWEAPEVVTRPHPVILVHGGGGQGSDYTGTPDGRPGWLDTFVQAGFLTYVVDRPGHGRSWFHPDVVGEPAGMFPYEAAAGLFSPPIPGHTQAVWSGEPGEDTTDNLVSGMGFVHSDYAEVNRMDADRLAKLLDRTGPAVIVTHSAGAPAGWLVGDLRHDLVKAHVAIEPIGPAFGEFPGLGFLTWGLSGAKPVLEPEPATPEELQANPGGFVQPGLVGIPTVVVVAEASPFTEFEESVSDFVNALGGSSEFLNIGDHGVHGNGHGLMLEANSDEAAGPIIEWISRLG